MTSNTTVIIPELPAPLDPTKFYTRAQVTAHRLAEEAHYAAKAQVAEAERQAKIIASSPKEMTDAEYDERALARYNAMVQRQVEQAAADYAAEQRRIAFLAETPEEVLIQENNPHSFLELVQHRVRQGYAIDFSAHWMVLPTFCSATMKKMPAPGPKKVKAAA